jgi:DNA-directed RNA polymerase subunit beta'
MLQEAVDALIDNGMRKGQTTTATTGGKRLLKSLADMLKGKQGRFRQNLLGKRVDYSGRSVIVVGPQMRFSRCGLPKKMALELFKPFVIKKIIDQELAYNVRAASRLIEQETAEVWAILEEVVKDKWVLLNRAPTLHRLGIQAFKPILIEGEVIRLHPLVCRAFNADFDGDQMAVHLPLSDEAQNEAKNIMASELNLLKPANGGPVITPTQDIVLGCYILTRINDKSDKTDKKIFSSPEEAKMAYELGYLDLGEKIKVRNPKDTIKNSGLIETSVGRIIFNEALPDSCVFINQEINSKKLESIISEIIEIKERSETVSCLDKIKNLGFEYSTFSKITWGMDDLAVPRDKEKQIKIAEKEVEAIDEYYNKGLLSREERTSKIIEIWQKTKLIIEKMVPKALPQGGSVFSIISSGARGSWSQPVQMSGMKGLVINPAGQIIELPIKSSYKEGFNVLEFFIATHGARKGTTDTALRTSTAGYLTRRLVDVAHEVVVSEEDCGDEEGIDVFRKDADELGQDFALKIVSRVSLEDVKHIMKKGEIIDRKKAKKIIDAGIEKIHVRSPMKCKSPCGVCAKCYGWSLGNNQLVKLGEAVGIVAAQAIGEPGTQLTMRTFHTGGVASGGDITQGLPRVQEIFERREPGGKAIISLVHGVVKEITEDRVIKIKAKIQNTKPKVSKISLLRKSGKPKKEKKEKEEIVEYKLPKKRAIWVEKGQEVRKGQQLCEGNIDLRELFKATSMDDVQRYIVKEIQRIYNSQGAIIHDKHIETIIKQMFSRVKIKDQGDTHFSKGSIKERTSVLEANAKLGKGAKPAVYQEVLLGISEVALTTDSFLSAASFQETSRVLIRAAIEAKEDRLKGLKENVMLGKLIPAGTGFRK